AAREAADRPLPKHVRDEFESYLKCGRLEHGFLRVRCSDCHAEKLVAFSCKKRGFCPSCGGRRMAETAALLADEVLPRKPLRQWVLPLPFALRFLLATDAEALSRVLGIVYRAISGFILRKAKLERGTGATGAVTLIQRFGSALNLNVHLHILVLDGAFLAGTAPPVFRRIAAPTERELQGLVEQIAERIGRALERDGLISRDYENTYLNFDPTEGAALNDLLGHSITYRVAVGPRTGQRLCRYVSRPAIAAERLTLTPQGDVRFCLKTPYRDGTTHIVLEPLDFMARLAALVPPPRVHQTRYHGVFAPGSALRAAVTPCGRGQGARPREGAGEGGAPKALRMTWMQRLKRVFAIEIETCQRCGGKLERSEERRVGKEGRAGRWS